jgi:hypoxia-inducible factor (prolyl hydroxylase)
MGGKRAKARKKPASHTELGSHHAAAPSSDDSGDGGGADALFFLRTKYTLLGKAEWWWLMDESLAEIDKRLASENYVVIDNFLPREAAKTLRAEVQRAHDGSHLHPGVLAGGKAGDSTQYTMKDVRGDHVGWFSGAEPDLGWEGLPAAMRKADTLVNELGQLGGEARHVSSRSQAMCTVYPGAGARYVRHVDNPDKNGRLLTALLYLNVDWEEGDGGELRIFRCLENLGDGVGFTDCDGRSLAQVDAFDTTVKRTDTIDGAIDGGGHDVKHDDLVVSGARDVAEGVRDVAVLHRREGGGGGGGSGGCGVGVEVEGKTDEGEVAAVDAAAVAADKPTKPVRLTDVAPLGGRLVLFKSNARVPHEVLAAVAPRYAITLWYFHKEEVTAARSAPRATDEERAVQEAKIAREIEVMTLKYGGGGGVGAGGGSGGTETQVKVRESQADEWREVDATARGCTEEGTELEPQGLDPAERRCEQRSLPCVPPPCEASWDEGDATHVLVVRVPLPAGTGAGQCSAEVEPPRDAGADCGESGCSYLILEAPGLPEGVARIALPVGADDSSIAIKLVKKPERALVVRLHCPFAPPPPPPPPAGVVESSWVKEQQRIQPPTPVSTPSPLPPLSAPSPVGRDCVGVGGTLSWSSATEFSPLPAVPPRAKHTAPRGVDLRDAGDWEDYIQVRWAIAGCEDQPLLTPHTLDGLSFPVTLAWALQQKPVSDAIAAARAAAVAVAAGVDVNVDVTSGCAAAAAAAEEVAAVIENFGDGQTGAIPLTIIVAGASAITEQYLLDHTRYWDEVTVAAPQPRGGVHLAFVGPDVCLTSENVPESSLPPRPRRLSPSLTASVHNETVRDYLARLPPTSPALLMGFNTGMGGGGGSLARAWAADLVDVLRRPGLAAVFTAANDYADLRGELAVFRALGARFILEPRANPMRAYTHTIAEGDGAAGLRSRPSPGPAEGVVVGSGPAADTAGTNGSERWSCANAFVYAVEGFQRGKGLDGGLSEDQLCTLAAGAAERAAGAAWDALGMKR